MTKDPEPKTSSKGNSLIEFPIVVNSGVEGVTGTWWNCKVMENLYSKLHPELLKKGHYCKFIGLGSQRSWEKDGRSGTSNDLLVTGIEMQDGEFIQADKKDKEPGEEG